MSTDCFPQNSNSATPWLSQQVKRGELKGVKSKGKRLLPPSFQESTFLPLGPQVSPHLLRIYAHLRSMWRNRTPVSVLLVVFGALRPGFNNKLLKYS